MAIKVKFISEVEVKSGKKVLKTAKNANIKINNSCEGKGKCGKCIIKVLSGKLSEPTKQELKVLGQEKINNGYRLSCQAQMLEDSVIEIINDDAAKVKEKNSDNIDYKKTKIKEENIDNKAEIKHKGKKKVKEGNINSESEIKDNNKLEVKKENISNKIETKDNSKKKVNKENTDSKVEIKNNNKSEVKEESIGNKIETKDNSKTKVKKDNIDNKVKTKEDTKVLVKNNKSLKNRV